MISWLIVHMHKQRIYTSLMDEAIGARSEIWQLHAHLARRQTSSIWLLIPCWLVAWTGIVSSATASSSSLTLRLTFRDANILITFACVGITLALASRLDAWSGGWRAIGLFRFQMRLGRHDCASRNDVFYLFTISENEDMFTKSRFVVMAET